MSPPLLADQIAEAIGCDIVAGRLEPGSLLRLGDLEAEHGVSRTVARDVVNRLAQVGLVGVRRRLGTVVNAPDAWDDLAPLVIRWRLAGDRRLAQLQWLSELRSGVEPVAASLAARHSSPECRRDLLAAARGMVATAAVPDLEAYLRHDIAFHHLVLTGSGNPMFASLGDVVAEVLTGRTQHHLMPDTPNPEAVAWHVEVAEAVATGDWARAAAVTTLLVEEAQAGAEEMAAADRRGRFPGRPRDAE